MPSCLQDSDFTIVCGQNRFKTFISLLQNFLPGQMGGRNVQFTANEQQDGTGILLLGLNHSGSHTVAVTQLRHESWARPAGAQHCLLSTCLQARTTQGHLLRESGSFPGWALLHPAPWLGGESPEVPSGRVASPFPGAAKPPQGLHPHPACIAQSGWHWKGPLGIISNPPAHSKLLNLHRSFPTLLPCQGSPTAKRQSCVGPVPSQGAPYSTQDPRVHSGFEVSGGDLCTQSPELPVCKALPRTQISAGWGAWGTQQPGHPRFQLVGVPGAPAAGVSQAAPHTHNFSPGVSGAPTSPLLESAGASERPGGAPPGGAVPGEGATPGGAVPGGAVPGGRVPYLGVPAACRGG